MKILLIHPKREDDLFEDIKLPPPGPALQSGHDVRNIPGIAYHDGGRVSGNPPGPFIQGLDRLPFPAHKPGGDLIYKQA